MYVALIGLIKGQMANSYTGRGYVGLANKKQVQGEEEQSRQSYTEEAGPRETQFLKL